MGTPKSSVKTFEAVLERSGDRLNWTIVRIPFDVCKLWGKRGQLRVLGEINGFEFRSALFPTGQGTHILMVNKKMQAGGKVTPGAKARFRMEPDIAPREIKTPPELQSSFRQSKQLKKFYDSFNLSMRRYIAAMVAEGKHPETRTRRAEQLAEWMMEAMEAERELPPLIQVAFHRNPKARAGWELMSARHRRSHLLGIFYSRNPASRARRLAKAVEEMVKYVEKKENLTAQGTPGQADDTDWPDLH